MAWSGARCALRWASPPSCGTTRPGMSSPASGSGPLGTPAPSLPFPLGSSTTPACSYSPESSPTHRRSLRRLMRSPRPPALPTSTTSLLLAALRGHEARALEVIGAGVQLATARCEGRAIGHAEHAVAVLYNGLGRYPAALAAAQRACEHEDLGVFGWALAELVEAGARGGAPPRAPAPPHRAPPPNRATGTA